MKTEKQTLQVPADQPPKDGGGSGGLVLILVVFVIVFAIKKMKGKDKSGELAPK